MCYSSAMTQDLSAEQLRKMLHYDPETGVFVWIERAKARPVGVPVGCPTARGYLRAGINKRLYYLHRLAWLYVYGEWPDRVDHINGNAQDNRIANLRSVSHQVNLENLRRAHVDSRTGVLGVCQRDGKFIARIKANGRRVSLGRFASLEEARAAYIAAKRELHQGNTL